MFSFLRKIRKSLIESGSARKYILYAIGEILLVMIGILLALQVNNWNETKKNHRQYIKYINGMISDIKLDIEALDRNEMGNQRYDLAARNLINIYQSNLEFKNIEFNSAEGVTVADTIRLLFSIQLASFMAAPPINNFTIEDIQSSGNTSILKNEEIKRDIFNYYSRLREFEEWWEGKLKAKYSYDEVKFTLLDPILLNLTNYNEIERSRIMSEYDINPESIIARIRSHEGLMPVLNKMIYTRARISIENEWRTEIAQELLEKLEMEIDNE